MNTTILLCQILGIIITVFGLSVLVNKKSIIALLTETSESRGVLWILGFITLVLGALIITLNTESASSFHVLIKIIGWLTVVKGTVTLIFPDFTVSMYKKWVTQNIIMYSGLITFILGLVLLYAGFL